ncbi:MAG: hypothetical protein V4527_16145 [Pseudomonadota bacterium]
MWKRRERRSPGLRAGASEITAVPEIVRQAQVMSGAIMEYLGILNAASRVNRRH